MSNGACNHVHVTCKATMEILTSTTALTIPIPTPTMHRIEAKKNEKMENIKTEMKYNMSN